MDEDEKEYLFIKKQILMCSFINTLICAENFNSTVSSCVTTDLLAIKIGDLEVFDSFMDGIDSLEVIIIEFEFLLLIFEVGLLLLEVGLLLLVVGVELLYLVFGAEILYFRNISPPRCLLINIPYNKYAIYY